MMATDTEILCQHYWVIETADGPTSWGECQVCHAGREFENYVEGGSWTGNLGVKADQEEVPLGKGRRFER